MRSGARHAEPSLVLLAENSGGPEEEEDRHRSKQNEIGELGKQPAAIGVEQTDDDTAEDRAFETAETADDDDHQRKDEDVPFGAGVEREERTARDAGRAGEKRRERRNQYEQAIDVDSDRIHHFAVVYACAHDGADLCLLVENPQRHGGEDTEQDKRETVTRIVDVAGQRDRPAQIGRRLDAQIVAAPHREAHLADDEGDADGEQYLRQMIAADRADEETIDKIAEYNDREAATQNGEFEAAGRTHHRIADIAAKQIVRAIRHVDDAHQPKGEREPARQQE